MKKKNSFLIVALFVLLSSGLYSQSLSESCVIAIYPFNSSASDVSGNNYHGTVYGASLTTDRFGNDNCAYGFDGIDDYIDFNNVLLPTDGSDWSLSLWYQANNSGANTHKTVFSQYAYQQPGRFHIYELNADLNVFSSNFSGEFPITNIDNEWNCLVVTSINNYLSIYINGNDTVTNLLIENICDVNTRIGQDDEYYGRFFKGKIDDVRIYDCALSKEERANACDIIQSTKSIIYDKNISVFPNIVSDVVNIKTNITIGEIELYNCIGQKVKEINNPVSIINISDLPSGIYLINIYDTKTHLITTEKIIKK